MKYKKEKTIMVFKIDNIHCEKCAARIKKAMEGVDGVSNVVVSQPDNTASCDCDASLVETIKAALDDAGYTVVDVQ